MHEASHPSVAIACDNAMAAVGYKNIATVERRELGPLHSIQKFSISLETVAPLST